MPLVGHRRRHYKALTKIANSVRLNTIRTLNAQNPASLYCLPVELIQYICQHLPIAETFSLVLSCARFWHARASIQKFIKAHRLLKARIYPDWEFIEARFHILRLIEFDRLHGLGSRSFCCWSCMTTHSKSAFEYIFWPRVDLKFSIEEQRIKCTAQNTRSCYGKRRNIWVGICSEMTYAQLRILVFGIHNCKERTTSSITISAGFSEHIEFDLKTYSLKSRFYLGRLSDLGVDGFDRLCLMARLPICPHTRISIFRGRFLRGLNPNYAYSCYYCGAKYYLTLGLEGMIELHISRYVGPLKTGSEPVWINASYICVKTAFIDHCRAFSEWIHRMYNPETGDAYNGGFEMFVSSEKKKYRFYGSQPGGF